MRSTTCIPIWRTIVNWFIVVFLGSIIAPMLLSAFELERFDVEIIPAFMLVSGVCSLPAVSVFILVNWGMNRKKMYTGRYRLWQGLVHFSVSILTFLVIGYMSGGPGIAKPNDSLLVIGGTYTLLGQIVWWLTFYSHEHMQSAPETNNHPNSNV